MTHTLEEMIFGSGSEIGNSLSVWPWCLHILSESEDVQGHRTVWKSVHDIEVDAGLPLGNQRALVFRKELIFSEPCLDAVPLGLIAKHAARIQRCRIMAGSECAADTPALAPELDLSSHVVPNPACVSFGASSHDDRATDKVWSIERELRADKSTHRQTHHGDGRFTGGLDQLCRIPREVCDRP